MLTVYEFSSSQPTHCWIDKLFSTQIVIVYILRSTVRAVCMLFCLTPPHVASPRFRPVSSTFFGRVSLESYLVRFFRATDDGTGTLGSLLTIRGKMKPQ